MKPEKQERIILFILALINFTHIIDFMIMMPLGPQLMRYFQILPQAFSYLVSSYTVSAGISGFLMAFWVDSFNRKKVLLVAYIGFVIGTIACGLADTYLLLMLARIVAGAFGGLINAQILSIIGDIIPFERRGSAMATIMLAFSMASIIGVPFGLYLANIINWQYPFLIVGGAGALLIPAIYAYIPSLQGHIEAQKNVFNFWKVVLPIWESRTQQVGILLTMSLIMGQFLVIPFLSPYMVANVGFTEETLPFIYFFGGILTFVVAPLVGKWSDKYGKFRMLLMGIFLSSLTILVLTHLPATTLPIALIFTSAFFIFTTARIIPAQAITTALVPPQQRGSYMSLSSSLQQLVMGLAAFVAGNIVVKNELGNIMHYNWVGYLSVSFSALGIVIALYLRKFMKEQNFQ
ncbi:MAG: MFS transporter [Cytophagales bacterium]|nr:MAG: MFS transporter [Cytophagales bacterium]